MNKTITRTGIFAALLIVSFLSAGIRAQDIRTVDKKNAKGEAFYIVTSLDRARSQILVKRPTEVTTLIKVDSKTQYLDENGKPIQLADLRAGDTVWVTAGKGSEPTASRIRKGPMTTAELHQLYLDYAEIKF